MHSLNQVQSYEKELKHKEKKDKKILFFLLLFG